MTESIEEKFVCIGTSKGYEIKKKVLSPGESDIWLTDNSKCKLRVRDIECFNKEGNACVLNLKTHYLNGDFADNIVVGEAVFILDLYLEKCLLTMHNGEICKCIINFHDRQAEDLSVVVCTIEVSEVVMANLTGKWEFDELFQIAQKHKDKGVEVIKENRIREAFIQFSKALKYVISMYPVDPDEVEEEKIIAVNEMRAKLYTNLAHCHLLFKQYDDALSLCNKVLDYDPEHVKARYRRCSAYMGLEKWEEAFADIQMVLKFSPHDKAAQDKANILEPKVQLINKNYNSIIKKMFKQT